MPNQSTKKKVFTILNLRKVRPTDGLGFTRELINFRLGIIFAVLWSIDIFGLMLFWLLIPIPSLSLVFDNGVGWVLFVGFDICLFLFGALVIKKPTQK